MEARPHNRGVLYRLIRSALAHLIVFDAEEVISVGTGFTFRSDGSLLTAAHVVAGGFPVKQGEVDQESRSIVAFFEGQQPKLYKPATCPFQIEVAGMKPLQLDLAILVPLIKPDSPQTHLVASAMAPGLGDEVYFAGYSNEVEFPFLADRLVLPETKGLNVLKRALVTGIKERVAGPMIKRATVGNVSLAQFDFSGGVRLKQSHFYIDNQIHDGASGGPIVDIDGTARGIISKRAVTKSDGILVPSGSTLGVGLELAAITYRLDAAA